MTYKNVSSNCRFGCVVIIAQRKEKVKPDLQEIVVQRVGLSMMCYTLGKENRTALGEIQLRGRMGKLL